MSSLRTLPVFAVLGSLTAAFPASAADTTPEQAAALQTALQSWGGALGSPASAMGSQPTKVTAEGDHFKVELLAPPELVKQGMLPDAPVGSLTATPLDGGRYDFNTLVIPSPMTVTLTSSMMAAFDSKTPDAGGPPGSPRAPGAAPGKPTPPPLPVIIEITTKSHAFHGVLDPSLATGSMFDSSFTGLHATALSFTADVAEYAGHSSWTPAGGGLANIASDSGFKDVAVTGTTKSDTAFAVLIKGGKVTSRVDGAQPGFASNLNGNMAALNAVLKHDGTTPVSPEQRRAAHDAVQAISAAFQNQMSATSLDGIKIAANGTTTDIGHTAFSGRIGSDAGKVVISGGMTIEGIASTAIPPGVYSDLLPRRIVLNPRIYGISRDDLVALVNHAIDADMKDPKQVTGLQAEGLGMLARTPLSVAIDELVLEIPGASLKGAATVDVAGPASIVAHGLFTMEGLESLIQKANTTPELQSSAAGLIFLKGIGKADGNTTTWNVTYQANKIMVNDTDLSAMLPGNQPRPQPRPARPPVGKSP
jgi:hypothetical protein